MTTIHRFRDLKVWQRSLTFVTSVYRATAKFPKSELFGLTGQFRRAATAIPLNIAEGAGSGTDAEFCRFLRIAFRSAYEVMAILDVARALDLLDDVVYREMTT